MFLLFLLDAGVLYFIAALQEEASVMMIGLLVVLVDMFLIVIEGKQLVLDTEYGGEIEIDGKSGFSKKEIMNMQRHKVAYLFQNYALVENETVEQNLMIALYFRKNVDKKEA